MQMYFMKFLYGDHPYGRPAEGDERAALEVIHFWSLLAMAIHPDCDDPLSS